jgi:hypothetical protein
MRGLKNLYEHVRFANFWDTANTKAAPSEFRGSSDEEDWKSLRAGHDRVDLRTRDEGRLGACELIDHGGAGATRFP